MLLIPRGEFISLRPSSLFPPFVLHSAKLFVCLRYTRGRYFSLPSTVQRVLCICTSALERSVLLTCVDMMEQSTEVEVGIGASETAVGMGIEVPTSTCTYFSSELSAVVPSLLVGT